MGDYNGKYKGNRKEKIGQVVQQDQIPDEVLNTILKAGCAAPVTSGKYDS